MAPPKKKKKTKDQDSNKNDKEVAENEKGSTENMEVDGDADAASTNPEDSIGVNATRHFNPDDYGPIEVPPAAEGVATYDIYGPRLVITKIVNENFKSYAGTQTLGVFHKSFTSIIGPNGSGKSNVIDSMLFVFGFRANKIRSKKISVLIHNSEGRTNINSCTVAVHFQHIIDTGTGDNDFTVVPDSQFVVARTAFKDNSSYYTVNGKRAVYKEVAALLRSRGIDLDHNRFLILQGEVEQIAMMKPKGQTENDDGMLEFLEDIIGSNRFKEPIEVLAKRVETLNEMRGEKLNRVKMVEKEKDDLEGAKNEAVEYLMLENDIVRHKNKLYQKYILECSENDAKAKEEYNKISEGMKEVNDKLAVLAAEKKKKIDEHESIHKEYEKLVIESEQAKEKFSEFEKLDVKLREELKHCHGKTKKLKKSLEQEKNKIEEIKAVPEQTEKAIESHKAKLEKLEAEKLEEEQKMAEVMESLKTETKGLQEEKEKKEEKLLELQKAVNETKSQFKLAQSELNIYLRNQESEQTKLADMEKNLQTAKDTLVDRSKALKELQKSLPETENIVKKAQTDLTSAIQNETSVTEELRNIRRKVEEAKISMQAAKSQGRVITALLEAKNRGTIPGVMGRLGDLGAIDPKYDVAISTACGALDNIVVDTIDSAQRCVQYLKEHNVGSATFIGLEKMAKWKEHAKRKISTPENVPRLFDLVKTKDEAILPAFYFALRDTLVANDLEQATRIAYGKQRFRVVTLQGQLIDQSGTMSGGGKTVCKGRMGASIASEVDPKEITNMENSLAKLTTEAQQSRMNKETLEELIRTKEKSLVQMKHALEKCQITIKASEEQQKTLVEQIKVQQEKVKAAAPDEKELKNLEKKVAAFKKEFEQAEEAASKVESEVQKIHKKIMDIGGAKMQAVQSRVDAVTSKIDQVTGQITKAQVALKTNDRNLKKAEEKAVSIEEEMTENKEKIEDVEKQLKQMDEDATALTQRFSELKGKVGEMNIELDEKKDAIAKIEEEENELQKEVVDVKHEVEKIEGIMKTNQQKIKHWKKERSQLSLTAIDGKEVEDQLQEFEAEDLKDLDMNNAKYEITVLEEKLAEMKPNMAAIAEYRKKEELYLQRVSELDKITDIRDQQRKYHEDLRKQRLDEFMAGFSVITYKLKEMYQMITLGGDAELELVDSLDPFSEGIIFSVRPPKKSWKNISNLSGGEKTLSSLALVFALHHYKPTPLYVMDEIDAALDFKNVSIVANYIKERTKNAQFIIISLRNNMFELADRLVGIYKTDNSTKSVTVDPRKMILPLQEVQPNVA